MPELKKIQVSIQELKTSQSEALGKLDLRLAAHLDECRPHPFMTPKRVGMFSLAAGLVGGLFANFFTRG